MLGTGNDVLFGSGLGVTIPVVTNVSGPASALVSADSVEVRTRYTFWALGLEFRVQALSSVE